MSADLLILIGGIGLFLYGMEALTAELRAIATDRARVVLGALAARPAAGFAAGIGVTALVQSSSATAVMVLGLVGAGALSFPQALPVILGANVGTTFTGWMVMTLGVKVDLGLLAYPALALGALGRLLARGALARAAGVLAGLALIFLALSLMKEGMSAFDDILGPDRMPDDDWRGRLALMGLGILATVVTQSSSAGVATAIVLLAHGHVGFAQAAAMIIGMSVGTTFTGVLASVGGTVAMRRAALAHLGMNLVQGVVALALLDAVARFVALGVRVQDASLALVLFHTGYALAGALVFLPFTGAVARLVSRVIADAPDPVARWLDRRFLSDPAAALDMAHGALRQHTASLCAVLGRRLAPGARPAEQLPPDAVLDRVAGWTAQIALSQGDPNQTARFAAMMSLIDHLRRLGHRATQAERLAVALFDPRLRREALALGAILRRVADICADQTEPGGDALSAAPTPTAERARRLMRLQAIAARGTDRLARRERRLRRDLMAVPAATQRLFALTDSARWLRRSHDHMTRIIDLLLRAEATTAPGQFDPDAPAPPPSAASATAPDTPPAT